MAVKQRQRPAREPSPAPAAVERGGALESRSSAQAAGSSAAQVAPSSLRLPTSQPDVPVSSVPRAAEIARPILHLRPLSSLVAPAPPTLAPQRQYSVSGATQSSIRALLRPSEGVPVPAGTAHAGDARVLSARDRELLGAESPEQLRAASRGVGGRRGSGGSLVSELELMHVRAVVIPARSGVGGSVGGQEALPREWLLPAPSVASPREPPAPALEAVSPRVWQVIAPPSLTGEGSSVVGGAARRVPVRAVVGRGHGGGSGQARSEIPVRAPLVGAATARAPLVGAVTARVPQVGAATARAPRVGAATARAPLAAPRLPRSGTSRPVTAPQPAPRSAPLPELPQVTLRSALRSPARAPPGAMPSSAPHTPQRSPARGDSEGAPSSAAAALSALAAASPAAAAAERDALALLRSPTTRLVRALLAELAQGGVPASPWRAEGGAPGVRWLESEGEGEG